MKYAVILLCCGMAVQDTDTHGFYIREADDKKLCQVAGEPIGCAYLYALYQLVRDEMREESEVF